jgi:hypothetical protein
MSKNWLIRTKSNHILGPITKDKMIELFNNGSVKPDDEVCAGNGFWFFVREEELVEKYVFGDSVQTFNPMSEAKDVLVAKASTAPVYEEDITLVNGVSLTLLKSEDQIKVDDLPPNETPVPEMNIPKKKSEPPRVKRGPAIEKIEPKASQTYFRYLAIIGFLLLFALVYYRKNIIRSLFQGSVVYAQDSVGAKKKSS